jgi:ribonuclease-3
MPKSPPRRARTETHAPAGLETLESGLGHHFADRSLLELALIHRSFAHEKGTAGRHNESLEFLGDAVLSLGVSQMLYRRFGQAEVGALARSRAFLVSEPNLARKARALKLGQHLRLGRGEEKGGGRDKDSLLSDGYEAVLAAVYLDGGLEAAVSVVARQFASQIARLRPGARTSQDFKTDLQEALQAVALPIPNYRVDSESGPDHRKMFSVVVCIGERQVARGTGTSKKAAEQKAARQALRSIETLIAEILARPDAGAP